MASAESGVAADAPGNVAIGFTAEGGRRGDDAAAQTEGAAAGGKDAAVDVHASEAGGAASEGGAFKPCPPLGTPCAVMPLGDSITFGYGSTTGGGYRVDLFSEALAANKSITFVGSMVSGPVTVRGQLFPNGNEGHSGYTIDDSASTKGISPLVDQAVSTYKPNIILLMIGTNDMHYSLDTVNAPTRLGKLIDRLTTDAPDALIVIAKIIPTTGAQNTLTQGYNAAIPAVVQSRLAQGKHLAMVDMYAAMKAWSSATYKDSEHPNNAGYTTMAQTWYPAIEGALP